MISEKWSNKPTYLYKIININEILKKNLQKTYVIFLEREKWQHTQFKKKSYFQISAKMGGHGHGEPYKVPDPSIYKVENTPQLLEVKEALARQGLKDPWLR